MPTVTTSVVAASPRRDLEALGFGIVSEPFSRFACSGTVGAASGDLILVALGIRQNDLITGVALGCNGSGNTITLAKVGLFSSTGTRLRISADQSANMTAGFKTFAFTATYTAPANAMVYAAIVQVGTTPAVIYRAGGAGGAGTSLAEGVVAGFPAPMLVYTGQADIPASVNTAADNGGYTVAPYLALY